MFDRNALYRMRCVRTLIDIVEQVPIRWNARPPMTLTESSVGLMLLWSWLRFERIFLNRCLESLGTDFTSLTEQVDALLRECESPENTPLGYTHSWGSLHEMIFVWLSRADREADALRQDYLGMEHLLLAFLADANSPIAALFARFGVDRRRLIEAIGTLTAAQNERMEKPIVRSSYGSTKTFIGTIIENLPAPVGMPKRFSMSIMMAWVTLFAVVFSGMKLLNAPPAGFGIVAIVMFCVGVGQMWLFGGNKPRVASVVSGAASLSISLFGYIIFSGEMFPSDVSILSRIVYAFGVSFFMLPIGAFFGYLAGGVTAGIVLGIEYFENRNKPKPNAEAEKVPMSEADEAL